MKDIFKPKPENRLRDAELALQRAKTKYESAGTALDEAHARTRTEIDALTEQMGVKHARATTLTELKGSTENVISLISAIKP